MTKINRSRKGAISFVVSCEEQEADIHLLDYKDLDNIQYAIRAHLESGKFSISLQTPSRPLLTLPEVFQVLVEELENIPDDVEVRCIVSSHRVVDHLVRYLPSADRPRCSFVIGELHVTVMAGEITQVIADALVNTSNTQLKLGGGVSGAFNRVCGPALQREMDRFNGLAIGDLVATGAHNLKTTRQILHVPTASGDQEVIKTALCNILKYCDCQSIQTVAIPGLGMGTGALNATVCAQICVAEVVRYAHTDHSGVLKHILFVLWTGGDYRAFESAFAERNKEKEES